MGEPHVMSPIFRVAFAFLNSSRDELSEADVGDAAEMPQASLPSYFLVLKERAGSVAG